MSSLESFCSVSYWYIIFYLFIFNYSNKKFISEHERFPTLADEISTIKEALEGAPVHAKEAVLKILERLTARVDRAERDRDAAVTKYRDLQLQHGLLEEELAKKRGELRELLRQDIGGGGLVKTAPAGDKDLESDQISEGSLSSSGAVIISAVNIPVSTVVNIPATAAIRNQPASASAGLPKIELRSPVRVIQEIARSRSSSARSEAREIYNQPSKVNCGFIFQQQLCFVFIAYYFHQNRAKTL